MVQDAMNLNPDKLRDENPTTLALSEGIDVKKWEEKQAQKRKKK